MEFLVLFAHMVVLYLLLRTVARAKGDVAKEELGLFDIRSAREQKVTKPKGRPRTP